MTVLWCGTEDVDFPLGGEVIASGVWRAGYGRSSAAFAKYNTNLPRSTPLAAPITSGWLSFRHQGFAANIGNTTVGLTKSSSAAAIAPGLHIGNASTSGKVALFRSDGTAMTQVWAESGSSVPYSGTYKFDLQFSNWGAATNVTLYLTLGTATPVVLYSGTLDMTATGIASVDQLAIGTLSGFEIVLADEDTRPVLGLVTLYPNTAGNQNTFSTPGSFSDLAEAPAAYSINDATAISSDTAGQRAEFALSNLPAGSFTIKAVKVAARALRGTTGPQSLKLGVRDTTRSITNVDAGRVLATTYTTYEQMMQVNPASSAAFTQAEIDGLQISLESGT